MKVINPATGEIVREHDPHDAAEVERRLATARSAFFEWRETPYARRSAVLRRAAEVLRDGAREHAVLMAEEMGKPLREGIAEANKCAWVCEHYAEHGEAFLADEPAPSDATESYVSFRPLGVVLAVMPWNFPYWQVFRFAAPALMAGNAGVLKHASNVPGCALAIERIMREAELPAGVFSTVLVGSERVPGLIADDRIAAVTLTGSTPAGSAVARCAGEALKKSVLELGGSDPYVVLADADLEATVESCVTARLINGGQSCIAAKRLIVVGAAREPFERMLVERMAAAKLGDPMDEGTAVGPQAREDLRDELHRQVRKSVERGARLLLGGEVPDRPGAWYPPSVLTDVGPGMPAYDEELFGPVAAVIPVADEAEAIRVANDTVFGLGAAVFTADRAHGERIARDQLEAGACFVNSFVRSDPRLPFGGVKTSGYGRELGVFGIREFVNIKTVYVA